MKLTIEGMTCQNCVRHVRTALSEVEGVTVRSVDMGTAEIDVDPARLPQVLEAVQEAGYVARVS